jgi:hypothetical protein
MEYVLSIEDRQPAIELPALACYVEGMIIVRTLTTTI